MLLGWNCSCDVKRSYFPLLQMVNTEAREDGSPEGFPFQLLPTRSTAWRPDQAKVILNARMDAALVPSPASPGGTTAQLFCPLASLHGER